MMKSITNKTKYIANNKFSDFICYDEVYNKHNYIHSLITSFQTLFAMMKSITNITKYIANNKFSDFICCDEVYNKHN